MVKPCFTIRKQKEKRKEEKTAGLNSVFPFTLSTAESLLSSREWQEFTGD